MNSYIDPGKRATFLLGLFTMLSFAANSIFCRLALKTGSIGALEFTLVRLTAGALVLVPIIVFHMNSNGAGRLNTSWNELGASWRNIASGVTLFGYALFFSLAYVQLDAATGALILFMSVQFTMVGVSIYGGNRLTKIERLGFTLALSGLVYLLLPGLSAPPIWGAAMMVISGVAWGLYSLLGRNDSHPIFATARNFLYCIPGCAIILLIVILGVGGETQSNFGFYSDGVFLAILSGAVTSGLGYLMWYKFLKRTSTTVASIVQLSVPIFAALGGIFFLEESMSLRLAFASVTILGGIVVTIVSKTNSYTD